MATELRNEDIGNPHLAILDPKAIGIYLVKYTPPEE